jgi:hypothetical protein
MWFPSTHFDFVDYLDHAVDPGHGLLGNLFLVEAGQATSQEEDAVIALTQDSPYGIVRAVL